LSEADRAGAFEPSALTEMARFSMSHSGVEKGIAVELGHFDTPLAPDAASMARPGPTRRTVDLPKRVGP